MRSFCPSDACFDNHKNSRKREKSGRNVSEPFVFSSLKGCFHAEEVLFPSRWIVMISIYACKTASCGFSFPYFCSALPSVANKRFSRDSEKAKWQSKKGNSKCSE
ncbi:hypothetical protein DW173_19850 [Bacteroides sp. AM16-13]|nr:hypothetical protein DW173_19850 [Bacteroides sp. AM16-13]